MEIMVMVDACAAPRPAASPPPFPISATPARTAARARRRDLGQVVANMLQVAGVDRVLTMDLHADQIQGFFDIPWTISARVRSCWATSGAATSRTWSSCPRTSAAWCEPALAKRLEADLAIIDKRRPRANVSEVMNIIGEVDGRTCIIMDDMVDTAGTLCKAAQA